MTVRGATTPPTASGDTNTLPATSTHVLFSVDETLYCLPVEVVQRTLPVPQLTRLPTSDHAVLGVFQLMGRIITLWDARRWLQAGNDPPTQPWLLVVDHGGVSKGILVDRVIDVLTLTDATFDAHGSAPLLLPPGTHRGILKAPVLEGEPPVRASGFDQGPIEPEQAERWARVEASRTLAGLSPVHGLRLGPLFGESA